MESDLSNSKRRKLTIGKKEYDLLYTTEAQLEFLEKYGGIESIQEQIEGLKSEEKIKMFAWMIALLANQCVEIDNEDNGTNDPKITEEYVIKRLLPVDLMAAGNVVMEAIAIGNGRTIKDDEDETVDEVLEEIEGKNAEGAAGE